MLVETNPDHLKARAFFQRVLSRRASAREARLVVITHLVDSAIPFVPALDEVFEVQAYLGKPSSIQERAQSYLTAAVPGKQYALDKSTFRSDPAAIVREAFPDIASENPEGPKLDVVLLDIGGYFVSGAENNGADGLVKIQEELESRGYRLRGVVEDTENGHKRYLAALKALPKKPTFSVYSVARSPLKRPENHLVGVAVTFSVEALLRQSNIVLQSRRAGVIGFGPIGRSVAHSLRNRGIAVSICEVDPVQLASAAAQGFKVYHYSTQFENFARDLNLIVSATGAGAARGPFPPGAPRVERPINPKTVQHLRRGVFIASVTSCDDEIDLEGIRKAGFAQQPTYNADIQRWVSKDPSRQGGFYLLLEGNAVNFRHEGVIGPAIQLLQGEIAACINHILEENGPYAAEVLELDREGRSAVADMWLDQYLSDSAIEV